MNQMTTSMGPSHKSIGIIQISRIGDLLQTCQAVSDLKKVHNDTKLILIARKQFALPIEFITKTIFDEVIYLDIDNFCEDITNFNQMKAKAISFLKEVNNFSFDLLVNLTFSRTSAFLSTLISSKFRTGSYFNQNLQLCVNDTWSQYLYSNVLGNKLNPFSLVDIYRKIIGLKDKAPTIQKINSKKISNIVIHPFASHARKHWKAEKWREVIYKILKDNPTYTITLVGNSKEKIQSIKMLEGSILNTFSNRIKNLVGEISLEEVLKELNCSQLFLGHDSSIGHLSKFANCTSITISLGTVRPIETTPYGENSYCLTPATKCFPCNPNELCAQFKCHMDVPYQTVNTVVNLLLKEISPSTDSLSNNIPNFLLSAANVYKLTFEKSKIATLTDTIKKEKTDKEIFQLIYKILWQFSFSEAEENMEYPLISKTTFDSLYTALKGLEHIYELSAFGKKFCHYILQEISSKDPNLSTIKDYSNKVDELTSLLDIVKSNYPLLAPLTDLHKVQIGNVSGENLVEITESTYLCFTQLENYSSVLYELVEKILIESNHKKTELLQTKTRSE